MIDHRSTTRGITKDMTGVRCGRLVAIEFAGTQNRKSSWLCRCDCGNQKIVTGVDLRSGNTKSCGCLLAETNAKNVRKRAKYTPEEVPYYRIWYKMIARCHKPKDFRYELYGGRGIVVCERWHVFKNFYQDMGNRPSPKHSIDRIDNNGNYDPENCRWATQSEQATNKRNNRRLTHDGRSETMTEWSRITGISLSTIFHRLKRGLTVAEALMRPPNPRDLV